MLSEFTKACFMIFAAEMGDKTQILAMAFATRYKAGKVLAGIFLGVLLNHGLAVIVGSYLSTIMPISTVRIIAACVFIAFGLWTLRAGGESDHDENCQSKIAVNPVLTVAGAFFIGELGDKTQLTAIALSSDAVYPALILAGTVSGMLIVGGLGIYIGCKLGDRIPELAIKVVSSAVFILFGVISLAETTPKSYHTPVYVIPFFVVLASSYLLLLRSSLRKAGRGEK